MCRVMEDQRIDFHHAKTTDEYMESTMGASIVSSLKNSIKSPH